MELFLALVYYYLKMPYPLNTEKQLKLKYKI